MLPKASLSRAAASLALNVVLAAPVLAASDPENTLVMTLKCGDVVIDLLPDLAPKHVARIKKLTRQGFYDGIVFHRVIDGFMAQTGDRDRQRHRRLAGARSAGGILARAFFPRLLAWRGPNDPNSANSQFFIMFADAALLNGNYTVLGQGGLGHGRRRQDQDHGEPPANPDKIDATAGRSRRPVGRKENGGPRSPEDTIILDQRWPRGDRDPARPCARPCRADQGAGARAVLSTASCSTASSKASWRNRRPDGHRHGGSGKKLKAEFSKRARARHRLDGARPGPEFRRQPVLHLLCRRRFLDGQYTVWGKVIEGMENVDKIKRGEPVQNPDKIVKMQVAADCPLMRVDCLRSELRNAAGKLIAVEPGRPRDDGAVLHIAAMRTDLFDFTCRRRLRCGPARAPRDCWWCTDGVMREVIRDLPARRSPAIRWWSTTPR